MRYEYFQWKNQKTNIQHDQGDGHVTPLRIECSSTHITREEDLERHIVLSWGWTHTQKGLSAQGKP
jgi:hypothetical protein